MPETLNLDMYQGDNFAQTFEFVNPPETAEDDSTPYDLTDIDVRASLRARRGATAVDFTVTIPDPTLGVVTLSLAPAVTAEMPDYAIWDLEFVFPGDLPYTVFAGNVRCRREVTVP